MLYLLFHYRVVVVAAHWDTVDGTGGLNDNGSGGWRWRRRVTSYPGMAAMLELARALSHGQCANRSVELHLTSPTSPWAYPDLHQRN